VSVLSIFGGALFHTEDISHGKRWHSNILLNEKTSYSSLSRKDIVKNNRKEFP